MKTKFSKAIRKTAAILLAAVLALGAAGCGGSDSKEDTGDRTVIYFAASYVTASVRSAYQELITTYNAGQGVEDGVYVQMTENAGAIGGLESALRENYMYDVIQLLDDEFKALAIQGDFFVTLDEYLTDDIKEAMQWDDIPENTINRFRLDTEVSEDGKYHAGEGAGLLALPNGSNPQVLYYNKGILEDCGINVISVPESELEAYNAENNATLQAHGYAEYKEAPYADAMTGENESGAYVYKVFNESIPMNWEEARILYRAIQQQYGYEYGFMSEWWFAYGFSIGADCVGWDEESNNYVFTLGDKQPGYLALEDIEVNGNTYEKGEVLHYEDKTFINNNESEKTRLSGKIYELPSTYDMIIEFERLGVPADKQVEEGIYGYGVAPSTTENRTARFTSGTDCPFLVERFQYNASYKSILGDDLGMAVTVQYREYEGGSTYTEGGKEYLKVIGETYDGEVFTGEIKTENGTAIMGEATSESVAQGLFIPKNTKNQNYEAAVKFASWVAGLEGQKILSQANTLVPNQTSYGLGEYNDEEARTMNLYAGPFLLQNADIGDYTYFASLTWITEWSTLFNSDVREGEMTFTEFLNQKQEVADTALKGMNIRIYGR